MTEALTKSAAENVALLRGPLKSGLLMGLSRTGQQTQVVWEPIDAGEGRKLALHSSNRMFVNRQQLRQTREHLIASITDNEGNISERFVVMGSVARHHLPTTHFVTTSGMVGIDKTTGQSKLGDIATPSLLDTHYELLNPNEVSRSLGRYACGWLTQALPESNNVHAAESRGILQFLARRPEVPLGTRDSLAAVPLRIVVSGLLENGLMAPGFGYAIDEYSVAPKPELITLALYGSAEETAQKYARMLGPEVVGAVKEIGPGPHQQTVLFGNTA